MIDQIAGFLQRNLIVFLAVLILPLKWGVVRFWGDKEAEVGAIIAVPEDLCYVTLGLVLSDVISNRGAFRQYFQVSSHIQMDLVVTVASGFAFALLIHPLGGVASRQFYGWRAAESAEDSPGADKIPNAEENFFTLKLRHMLLFLLAYGLEFAIIYFWIHWVAKVISVSSRL